METHLGRLFQSLENHVSAFPSLLSRAYLRDAHHARDPAPPPRICLNRAHWEHPGSHIFPFVHLRPPFLSFGTHPTTSSPSFVHSSPFGESFLSLFFIVPLRSLTEGRLLRKPSAETQELEQRLEPDNLRSPSPGPRAGGWLSISLTMRPPRSAPVPGLIVWLRLLRRRPLPLHIPTRSDLSGWRPLGPKVKGCPALRGGISGANRLTGFPAVQSECAADTQLCGDSPPASASLGVACMEGG